MHARVQTRHKIQGLFKNFPTPIQIFPGPFYFYTDSDFNASLQRWEWPTCTADMMLSKNLVYTSDIKFDPLKSLTNSVRYYMILKNKEIQGLFSNLNEKVMLPEDSNILKTQLGLEKISLLLIYTSVSW